MKEKVITKNLLAIKITAITAIMALAATALLPLTVKAEASLGGETVASITFTQGDLSLIDAPDINFGTHQVSLDNNIFALNNTAPVTVSDARGNGGGWTLTADLSIFEIDAKETLQGAAIEVTDPQVSAVGETPSINPPVVPTDANKKLILTSGGGIVKILEALPGNGRGEWESVWDPSNTALNVKPGTAETNMAGSPSIATLTWLLTDAP